MMLTTILAYSLILSYFVIERSLRKHSAALSLKAEANDRGSSRLILISGMINIVLALLAPALNAAKIGFWKLGYGCWLGLCLMLLGLALRAWAAITLDKLYTRTLRVSDRQEIIDRAPYTLIRHPGYAGISLLEIGAGLAVGNWLVLVLVAIIGLQSRLYRIEAEESMLLDALPEYRAYQARTWRLIPFVY